MTLAIAWIRHVRQTRELVIAADSRLRSVGHWDGCPKVLMLPRSDAVMCFAGDTMHAYPLMLQVRASVGLFPKARSRAMDLTDLKGHIVRLLNGMRGAARFQLEGADATPATAFLLGGFSWKSSAFRLWTIYYDAHLAAFTARPATRWRKSGSKYLHFAGDDLFFDDREKLRIQLLRTLHRRAERPDVEFGVIDSAKRRLVRLLRERGKLRTGGFDMEPLEVLRDMLREGVHATIGGPPQVVKVYRHMNAVPFAIKWHGHTTVLGRTLLGYEKAFCPVLDPDSLDVDASAPGVCDDADGDGGV